jgi:hypothetical protein
MGASLHRDDLVQVVKQHVPFVNLPCMSTVVRNTAGGLSTCKKD